MLPTPSAGRAFRSACGIALRNRIEAACRVFCPSNIARLLLGVVIIVTLLIAIGFWLYHSPRLWYIESSNPAASPHLTGDLRTGAICRLHFALIA
jgi:hypothetical protein